MDCRHYVMSSLFWFPCFLDNLILGLILWLQKICNKSSVHQPLHFGSSYELHHLVTDWTFSTVFRKQLTLIETGCQWKLISASFSHINLLGSKPSLHICGYSKPFVPCKRFSSRNAHCFALSIFPSPQHYATTSMFHFWFVGFFYLNYKLCMSCSHLTRVCYFLYPWHVWHATLNATFLFLFSKLPFSYHSFTDATFVV